MAKAENAVPTMNGAYLNEVQQWADLEGGVKISSINPYRFMRESDNGTGGFIYGNYLTKHSRERKFDERRNYSFYMNYFKRIVNALSSPIYRDFPSRKTSKGQEFFDKFLTDCDRRGNSFNLAMKKAGRKTVRYGVYFAVVDNDTAEKQAANLAEAIEARKFPYLYFVSPENVAEHEWDENGALSVITFREYQKGVDGKKEEVFRKWSKTGWELFKIGNDKKKIILDFGVLSIGKIPVVPIYSEEPDDEEDPVMPYPPLYHIARTNLGIFDLSSEIRELERNQMFSVLTYPKTSNASAKDTTVGTKNMLSYDGNASHAPDYISPEAAIHEAVMKSREFLISQLFEMAALNGVATVKAKDESGRAKEWDFQATRERLADFASELQNAELRIFDIFFRYLGITDSGIEVVYSDNFGIIDDSVVTAKTQAELDLNVSPEVNQAIKKRWVKQNFRDEEPETIKALEESVTAESENKEHSDIGKNDPVLV